MWVIIRRLYKCHPARGRFRNASYGPSSEKVARPWYMGMGDRVSTRCAYVCMCCVWWFAVSSPILNLPFWVIEVCKYFLTFIYVHTCGVRWFAVPSPILNLPLWVIEVCKYFQTFICVNCISLNVDINKGCNCSLVFRFTPD